MIYTKTKTTNHSTLGPDTDKNPPRLIAFSGAHGTGKTTAAYGTAHHYKREYGGLRVRVLSELASECPFPLMTKESDVPSEAGQRWIFVSQIKKEMELMAKYDVVISDRSIVDCIAYTQIAGYTELRDSMMAFAAGYVRNYSKIFFKLVYEDDLADNDFRNLGIKLREEIEGVMLDLYAKLHVAIRVVP